METVYIFLDSKFSKLSVFWNRNYALPSYSDPEVPEPVTGEMNAPEAGAKDTSTNTPEKLGTLRSQTVSHEPDSELEVEWGRRERRLIRQHKAEEKKICKFLKMLQFLFSECSMIW
jgi:hypothetical protein